MKTHDLTLDSIASGAVPEKFAAALRSVLDNIMDPNTPAEAKRTITVRVTFRPEESRVRMDVDADVAAALAAPRGATCQAYIGQREGGEVVAVTIDPEQADLFRREGDPDVRPIRPPQQKEANS